MAVPVRQFRVIALVSSIGGKYHGCKVIPANNVYPAIYMSVFGPAAKPRCDAFVKRRCGGATPVLEALHRVGDSVESLVGRRCRYYKKGSALTQDFVPERVNIEHLNNKITRVWFG
jgi:hypothetical protein